jgi:hypothetical protein
MFPKAVKLQIIVDWNSILKDIIQLYPLTASSPLYKRTAQRSEPGFFKLQGGAINL